MINIPDTYSEKYTELIRLIAAKLNISFNNAVEYAHKNSIEEHFRAEYNKNNNIDVKKYFGQINQRGNK